jgi:hypothetical protein
MTPLTYRVRQLKRFVRFFFQRLTRGWDDSQTWNLDTAFALLILPRLKRFKELNTSFPYELTPEKWDDFLDEMIWAFEWYSSPVENRDRNGYERAHKGVQLFAQWYPDLWW